MFGGITANICTWSGHIRFDDLTPRLSFDQGGKDIGDVLPQPAIRLHPSILRRKDKMKLTVILCV